MNKSNTLSRGIELALFLGFSIFGLLLSSSTIASMEQSYGELLRPYLLPLRTLASAVPFLLIGLFFPYSTWREVEREEKPSAHWGYYVLGLVPILMLSDLAGQCSTFLIRSFLPSLSSIDLSEQLIRPLLYTGVDGALLNILFVALIPAGAEELYFRSRLQPLVMGLIPNRPYWAIALASALFSLAHGSLVGFLPRLILGFWLGFSYYRLGKLRYPILIHFLNNLLALALLSH